MSDSDRARDFVLRDPLVPVAGAILVAAALVLGGAVEFISAPRIVAAFELLEASFFLAGGGFLSQSLVLEARLRPTRANRASPQAGAVQTGLKSLLDRARVEIRRWTNERDWFGAWAPVVLVACGSLVAIALIAAAWRGLDDAAPNAFEQQLLGGAMIGLAFPLLVLNRIVASRDELRHSGSSALERLLRVPLLCAVATGLASLGGSLGFDWCWLGVRAVAIILALIAAELVSRAAAWLFVPLPPLEERSFSASAIAGLIAPAIPSFGGMNAAVRSQFGIDLSRSWAISFVRRAAIPVLFAMGFFAWILSGITALKIDQRAVYERFGVPVAVLGPGLHLHLPWPFGKLHNVEFGVVHEIPIVFPAGGSVAASQEIPSATVGAEDEPPPSVDRLWDASHPSEASYLIASTANGGQTFQIVNIDLRIVYRIGLSDDAAEAAAYRLDDPPALIRAESGRMLVRHFSRYTLFQVLGQNREAFVAAFRSELQARLDRLASGIDIIAAVIEAIHPPPEAASAYQNVQASQINSVAQISLSRGDAIRKLKFAAQVAIEEKNGAEADAGEQLGRANADSTLFGGDRQAYEHGGQAYLFERWLGHLDKALPQAPLIVVDHRLEGPAAPTLDLRHFGAGSDMPAPTSPDD